MKDIRFIISLLAILIIASCLNACTSQKTFYQEGSGWNFVRFPLVEPYYVIMIIDDYEWWSIPLFIEPSKRDFLHYRTILDVTKIAVENGAIMVYSQYSEPVNVGGGQLKELHWFILIPEQVELAFETEEEFKINLKEYGISQPQWLEPKSILQTYDQTGCLEWIPNCN